MQQARRLAVANEGMKDAAHNAGFTEVGRGVPYGLRELLDGARLLQEALLRCERPVVLHAQSHLVAVYGRHGFVPDGTELLDDGIPCYVEADADEGEPLAIGGAMKVGVIVAESDVPKVGDLLKRRFEDLVKKEGVGSFNVAAIDLSAAEIECPSCGHKGALANGACGDCGLFLGAPE